MGTQIQPQTDPNALTLAKKPQVPAQAGGTPPLTMAQATPAIPTPTIAAPSAPVDRLKLATDVFNQSAASTAPAYEAARRDELSNSAGLGQIASGGLRTREGNLELARGRDLDTMRAKLVNDATTGSIADATTAFQQGLAGAQQGLAGELGRGNLELGHEAQDTSRLGTVGGIEGQKAALELAKGEATGTVGGTATLGAKAQTAQEQQAAAQLELAKTGQTAQIGQGQQQIDLQKQRDAIQAQVAAGTLSVEQGKLELDKVNSANANTIATGQLTLAGKAETAQESQAKAALAEQTASRLQQGAQFTASLAQSGDQFNRSLEQNATQFGLSQDQTQKLAKLQDATANRSIDVSEAQGQKQLLVQLASILGGPTGVLNPTAMAGIAKMFGVTLPANSGTQGPVNGDQNNKPGSTGSTTDPTINPSTGRKWGT